ncbi:glycosyltransferase, partial [Patescibacteria group bacterium]|nr:glycosyltransferase [Patescibacteria group bacterium]
MLAPTPFFADRGCHIRIYEEAKALQEKGHNVDIFTYHNGRDIEGLNIHRIINIPWYKKLSAGPSWHKLYLDVLLMFNVMFLGFFKNYDVIHAHLHEGCIIGFF